MFVTSSINTARKLISKAKLKNKLIGFVPTMGALHSGHISLVKKAKKECDFVVVSIFVNPAQFGPAEDFKHYPRPFKKDKALLQKDNVDIIFYPKANTLYPKDFSTYVEESSLSKYLCGKSRPAHFKGVCTVVTKLFNIIQPDTAYFGTKDYQQAQIIKRMVNDLNFPVRIRVLPIAREKDGLAMSSRNAYLNYEKRKEAVCLYRSLSLSKKLIKQGERNSQNIINKMTEFIQTRKDAKIDYIKIVDADKLSDLKTIKGKILIAIAVFIGGTRLIDNVIITINK